MATKKKITAQEGKFLKAYLEVGSKGFMNSTESAVIAGYKCTTRESFCNIGNRVKRKLQERIDGWLEREGFTDSKLKSKVLELMEADETVFQKVKGELSEDDLTEGVKIITHAGKMYVIDPKTKEYREVVGETVIGINVQNKELQRRALDMAIKIRGLYAADKVEVTGLGDLAKIMTEANKRVENGST